MPRANPGTVPEMNEPHWLAWAKQIQAIAQIGLTYTRDPYDRERYEQLRHIAAEIFAAGSDFPLEQVRGLFAGETGYATPKVDTRGVVFREEEILLVREREDGCWTLPGGWADVLESPAESVVREIREESGYETRATKLLAVYDRSKHPHVPPYPHHVYKLFFHCELLGGEPTTSHEITEVGFFKENALPELSVGRVTEGQIHRFFEHRGKPGMATDFD